MNHRGAPYLQILTQAGHLESGAFVFHMKGTSPQDGDVVPFQLSSEKMGNAPTAISLKGKNADGGINFIQNLGARRTNWRHSYLKSGINLATRNGK
jgi:hypothetical protein